MSSKSPRRPSTQVTALVQKVDALREENKGLSLTKACAQVGLSQSVYKYRKTAAVHVPSGKPLKVKTAKKTVKTTIPALMIPSRKSAQTVSTVYPTAAQAEKTGLVMVIVGDVPNVAALVSQIKGVS